MPLPRPGREVPRGAERGNPMVVVTQPGNDCDIYCELEHGPVENSEFSQ